MAHPKNRNDRRRRAKQEKVKVRAISTYGYNPYVGWAVIPLHMAESDLESGFWPTVAVAPENANKPYYIKEVNHNQSERRKFYKRRANRQYRRSRFEPTTSKSGHKRNYNIWADTI